jgi:hypothetical protein
MRQDKHVVQKRRSKRFFSLSRDNQDVGIMVHVFILRIFVQMLMRVSLSTYIDSENKVEISSVARVGLALQLTAQHLASLQNKIRYIYEARHLTT